MHGPGPHSPQRTRLRSLPALRPECQRRRFCGRLWGVFFFHHGLPGDPPPPTSSFYLVANNSVVEDAACAFWGWGCGGASSCPSLSACELACAEDENCTTINFSAESGDCVLRVCTSPAEPPVVPYSGYAVYTSTAPKYARPTLCAGLTLTPSAPAGALALGLWLAQGSTAAAYPSPAALFSHLAGALPSLAAQHSAFIAALPSSGGDAHFDESIRWLLAPAVLLTKGVGNQSSTMGYVEMCARDSYHTTWLHDYMWPSLEKTMLLELCAAQCSPSIEACNGTDGKIPTTILPLIYRDDNIDVTAYFVLRLGRYFESSGDVDTLSDTFPCLQRALAYLQSRDVEGSGLPAHRRDSFWADWLDVDYMQGRKYAPHTAFTFIGAMLVGAGAASALGEGEAAAQYSAAAQKGLSAAEALLWDASGAIYRDIWWDGARPSAYPNYALSDQTVATFLGLPLPGGRGEAMLSGVGAAGLVKRFGVVDLFPYLPGVDNPPSVYGNGGNYPWLTCMHANSLLSYTDTRHQGLALFQAMADQMLFNKSQPAQNVAWEYMQGETGVDMGAFPHGETAACFAVASRGASQWLRVVAPGLPGAAFQLTLLHRNVSATLLRPLHGLGGQQRTLLAELEVVAGELRAARIATGAVWSERNRSHKLVQHATAACAALSPTFAECSDSAHTSTLEGLRISLRTL